MFGQMFQKKTQTTTPEAARLEELLYYAVQQQQPMIVFTPQGEIVNANPLFLAAVGYAEPEIVGRHHRMFCAPEYARSRDYQYFLSISNKILDIQRRYAEVSLSV